MYLSLIKKFLKKCTYVILHGTKYPVPVTLNYFWTFGSLLFTCLVIQLLSGFILSIFYKPNTLEAFYSVERIIMREVPKGWLYRYLHANTASAFFFCSYVHIAKNIYYFGFFKTRVWISGLILFLALMAEAFSGYVLPWGQMSYWAATVISNFFSIIPFIGKDVCELLWGGYSVNEYTLKRLFSLHFILGFIILGIAILHIIALHDKGSSSSTKENISPKVAFMPLYGDEILFSLLIFLDILSYFVFFRPHYFLHPVNFQEADIFVTPPHIVPEWYFLPFYTILRVVPHKVGGILAMFFSILILFLLPFYNRKCNPKKITWNCLFSSFVLNVILLGYLGSCPAEPFYIICGQIATLYYFTFILLILPFYLQYICNLDPKKNIKLKNSTNQGQKKK